MQLICAFVFAYAKSRFPHDIAQLRCLCLQYGTRHILSEMWKCGHTTSMLYICGGLRKNPLYVQTHADVTGLFKYSLGPYQGVQHRMVLEVNFSYF